MINYCKLILAVMILFYSQCKFEVTKDSIIIGQPEIIPFSLKPFM